MSDFEIVSCKVDHKGNHIEIDIKVKVNKKPNSYMFKEPVWTQEDGAFLFHQFIEDNPVTKVAIEELQKLRNDADYNPNDVTARLSYLTMLVRTLDEHWH